jgi:hypothetical protein
MTDMPPTKMGRHHTQSTTFRGTLTMVVYGLTIAIFVIYAQLEVSRDGVFNIATIEILNPQISNVVSGTAFAACVVVLCLSAVSFKTRWLRLPGLGLAMGLLLYPCCVFWHMFGNFGSWTTHGEIRTDDGTTFVFCDSSFLQGQTMAIAKITSQDNIRTTYQILVENNGDSPRSWASVIRPEGSPDDYGQLYLKNDLLIGVRYGNRCFLAYDLRTGTAYGHGDIESLSPFIALSAGDTPDMGDLQRTCERVTEYADFCKTAGDTRLIEAFIGGDTVPGCPLTKPLRQLADEPDAELADVANALLKCYDRAYDSLKDGTPPPSDETEQLHEPDQ